MENAWVRSAILRQIIAEPLRRLNLVENNFLFVNKSNVAIKIFTIIVSRFEIIEWKVFWLNSFRKNRQTSGIIKSLRIFDSFWLTSWKTKHNQDEPQSSFHDCRQTFMNNQIPRPTVLIEILFLFIARQSRLQRGMSCRTFLTKATTTGQGWKSNSCTAFGLRFSRRKVSLRRPPWSHNKASFVASSDDNKPKRRKGSTRE